MEEIFQIRRGLGQNWRSFEFGSKFPIFWSFEDFGRERIFSIFLFWSWLLTVGDQESYDFSCWWPALNFSELSYFSRLWPITVSLPPRSTKNGDPSKCELSESKVCRSLSNKIKLREQGVTNWKASLLSVWKFQNVQFQLCYRSPTTIPSNGKLLLLILLCHF